MFFKTCLFTDTVSGSSVFDGVCNREMQIGNRTEPYLMRTFSLSYKITAVLFEIGNKFVVVSRAHLSKTTHVIEEVKFGLTRFEVVVKLKQFFCHTVNFFDKFFDGWHFCNKTREIRTLAPINRGLFTFVDNNPEGKSCSKSVCQFPERKANAVIHAVLLNRVSSIDQFTTQIKVKGYQFSRSAWERLGNMWEEV